MRTFYELLVASEVDHLNAAVNKKLALGWALYGDPVISSSAEGAVNYGSVGQAMIRVCKEEDLK